MSRIIFARDRRRKKKKIRIFLFLMAVLSIGIGIALSLKKQTPLNASSQENVIILDNLDNDIIDDVENPNSDTEQAEKKQDLTEDPNATSYDGRR